MNSLWDFFDGNIWCINVESRTDRKQSSELLFKTLGIPIRYLTVKLSKLGGIHGCFESHQTIIKQSLQEGRKNCLIFEDDVILGRFTADLVKESISFMKNTNWDLFYYGCFPDILQHKQTNVSGNIFQVRATQTHAYAINRLYMEKIANKVFDGTPIDEIYKKKSISFALLPSMFKQNESDSDVSSIQFVSKSKAKDFLVNAVENYAIYFGYSLHKVICLLFFLCVATKIFFKQRKINGSKV